MPSVDVVVRSPTSRSMRCRQLESMFDVPPRDTSELRWRGEVPLEDKPWSVGLIVGPSGSGKSTVAKKLFGDRVCGEFAWQGASVLDDFPPDLPMPDIVAICQAVGFNTIPAWLRPYAVLSNGEKFRVTLARGLVESGGLLVVDEFTSVVDRQVAQIGSHAVQKFVRKRGQQFVGVSCHYDILDWLQPDWVLEPATMTFAWREVQRRPPVNCAIVRVAHEAWHTFAPYHYLTAHLHRAAQCFVLFVEGHPAAFAAALYRPHARQKDLWGISRLVTLPDYQGLGLAFVLVDALGSAFRALAKHLHVYPAHPALIQSFDRSPLWQLRHKPGHHMDQDKFGRHGGRPCAVFRYIGPAEENRSRAAEFLGIPSLSAR